MKTPLISVVLPVYNVASFIKEALDSVLNQTVQDFEVLVIDDCSKDNTLSIVKSFEDKRIRIIEKPENKGLIDSLNMGFSEAKGQYIARMDGDDINVLNRFEKQLNVLQNNPNIKACGCWLQCFGASSKIIRHKEKHEQIQAQLLIGNPMSLGATMLNREAYKAYRFDPSNEHAEDYDFWARSAWDCKMYNIQEVLYHYRTHEEQVSSVYNDVQKNQDTDIKLSLYHKIDYDKNGYSDMFLIKMLFSNAPISITDCKQFLMWLNQIVRVNKKQQVFGNKLLLEVVEQLKRQFVFEIFFTNKRVGIDYKMRTEVLRALPFKQKLFVVRKKLKERVSFLRKTKWGI